MFIVQVPFARDLMLPALYIYVYIYMYCIKFLSMVGSDMLGLTLDPEREKCCKTAIRESPL